MSREYRRIAVIGAGPSGLAAVRALEQEGAFDYVRVFERKSKVGGLWAYEPEPDSFHATDDKSNIDAQIPAGLSPNAPCLTPATPEPEVTRSAAYDTLDTNAGARTMAFTHTPLPVVNSLASIRKYGRNNPSRPREVVLQYLEDLFIPYLHLLVLNTTVEKIEQTENGKWILTLRRRALEVGVSISSRDYWWQESFDAVVVGSGHFTVPNIPNIEGLADTYNECPEKFEHSKSWRGQAPYVNKKVVVVGGGISAADLVEDLHNIVQGPLHVSRRSDVGFLEDAWCLPNVISKPPLKRISSAAGGTLEFEDGSAIEGFDKLIFGTGYKLSYPFFPFEAVTPENRMAGFYQHIFHMDDPSLAVIGQVRAAISFRVYEYQAVAVSRFLAGRSASLPSKEAQKEWEQSRLLEKGPTELFHEIKPDFTGYYGWLREFAGRASPESTEYLLPEFEENWIQSDIEILQARQRYWAGLRENNQALDYVRL
ncbi:putative dimethylaniline monooxygenase [Aspergillus varians]